VTDCYDPETNTWTEEAPIPNRRAGAAYGTSCDGKLIVAGGEGSGEAWYTVDIFDGTSWTSLPDLIDSRHGTGLAVDCECNQMHIASGAGDQGSSPELTSLETWYPSGEEESCSHSLSPALAPAAAPVAPVPMPVAWASLAPIPPIAIGTCPDIQVRGPLRNYMHSAHTCFLTPVTSFSASVVTREFF
jgi:hypothetical protein